MAAGNIAGPAMRRTPDQIQADYYTATSADYDAMHVRDDDEHARALRHLSGLIAAEGYGSVLDVGSGTGRALTFLAPRHPGVEVRGVEPVAGLIDVAEERHGVAPGAIVRGSGDALPFADDSFDVVCEFAVLHHVPEPAAVVAEMTRVARRAVLLSDDNRFAHGSRAARLGKLALHRAGLWRAADVVRNRGRRWRYTDDDGVFYSYSVYDSYAALAEWADRIVLVPTDRVDSRSWLHPLLTSPHILLCALRDGP